MTQQWSRAFHDHPIHADGMAYISRYMGGRKSVVLFDRRAAAFAVGAVTPLLEHVDFPALVEDFNLAIEPPPEVGGDRE